MEKNILTLAETAQYLKVSEKTIQRLIGTHDIPCVRVGGQWRFLQSSLDHWLEARMQGLGTLNTGSRGNREKNTDDKKSL